MSCGEEPISDDEIFFGKLSIKEFKKHILWNPNGSNFNSDIQTVKTDNNSSIKIIETHSEPNLRPSKKISSQNLSFHNSPTLETSDDSFLKVENMVSNLSLTPRTSDNVELNNTLEVIEYILSHGSKQNAEEKVQSHNKVNLEQKDLELDKSPSIKSPTTIDANPPSKEENIPLKEENTPLINMVPSPESRQDMNIAIKTDNYVSELPKQDNYYLEEKPINKVIETLVKTDIQDSPKYFTPVKSAVKSNEVFSTPSSTNIKTKTPVFKTPANPLSSKKPSASSLKKTPGRSNAYQHITSPIASYIKNCPQVPLVKDVHPKKPLPGPSAIPKYIKNPANKVQNKENINLPSVAYKNAKKTKVINLPDEDKLPQSQWAKKLTSSLSKPMVMKHENREMNTLKKPLLSKHEDSFANLSYCQAEVSVCTQKTAFKSNNK